MSARHRTSTFEVLVQRTIGAMSSRVVKRPMARRASPTTGGRRRAVGSRREILRQRDARLRRPDLSQRLRCFLPYRCGRTILEQHLRQPAHRVRIFELSRREGDRGDNVGIRVLAERNEKRAPRRIDDAPNGHDGAAPDFDILRTQEPLQNVRIELPRILEHHELRDSVDVTGRQRGSRSSLRRQGKRRVSGHTTTQKQQLST